MSAVVVDTSALVAISLAEPEAPWFIDRIEQADMTYVSAGTLQEYLLVMAYRESRLSEPVLSPGEVVAHAYAIVDALGLHVVDVTEQLALLGAIGTAEHRHAPARLNYGDGFSYALASALDCPLVCKGSDFPATDIAVSRPPGA